MSTSTSTQPIEFTPSLLRPERSIQERQQADLAHYMDACFYAIDLLGTITTTQTEKLRRLSRRGDTIDELRKVVDDWVERVPTQPEPQQPAPERWYPCSHYESADPDRPFRACPTCIKEDAARKQAAEQADESAGVHANLTGAPVVGVHVKAEAIYQAHREFVWKQLHAELAPFTAALDKRLWKESKKKDAAEPEGVEKVEETEDIKLHGQSVETLYASEFRDRENDVWAKVMNYTDKFRGEISRVSPENPRHLGYLARIVKSVVIDHYKKKLHPKRGEQITSSHDTALVVAMADSRTAERERSYGQPTPPVDVGRTYNGKGENEPWIAKGGAFKSADRVQDGVCVGRNTF